MVMTVIVFRNLTRPRSAYSCVQDLGRSQAISCNPRCLIEVYRNRGLVHSFCEVGFDWALKYIQTLQYFCTLEWFISFEFCRMASPSTSDAVITIQDVQDAAQRIAPYIHKTPVMTCSTLDSMAGRSLHFKCDLFQKVGAFKVRLWSELHIH